MGADKSAENTQNDPKFICPKKRFNWASKFRAYNQMVVSGNADFYSMKIDYFPDKSFYFPNQKCITVAKLNELFSISSHLHKDERNYPSATLIMKTNKFWRLDEIEISF